MKTLVICFALVTVVFCQLIFPAHGHSCVGRILTLAITHDPDQETMGKVLAIFINERTGTTVEVKYGSDLKECQAMVKKGDVNLFINYLAYGAQESRVSNEAANSQEMYSLVKEYYLHKYQMVWLRPFGYKGPVSGKTEAASESPSLAVTVTTRKVLDRFPILDRVINKLSGKIDDRAMSELIRESENGTNEAVVKKFLKDRNLI